MGQGQSGREDQTLRFLWRAHSEPPVGETPDRALPAFLNAYQKHRLVGGRLEMRIRQRVEILFKPVSTLGVYSLMSGTPREGVRQPFCKAPGLDPPGAVVHWRGPSLLNAQFVRRWIFPRSRRSNEHPKDLPVGS